MLNKIIEMVENNADKTAIIQALKDFEYKTAKNAAEKLSYYELESVKAVLADGETEKIYSAKEVAQLNGITRSILVTAMDKLQTAGIIDQKSLGCKGCRLVVLNKNIFQVLAEVA